MIRRMRRSLQLWGPLLVALLWATGCDVPMGAVRRSPPSGIGERVVAVRTAAPDIALDGTDGPFHLAEAVAEGNVLLVFYRGHW